MTASARRVPNAFSLVQVAAYWQEIALGILILAAGVNRYSIEVAGLSVYPEYLALALVVPLLALAVWQGRLVWRWPRAAWPLLAWLAVALLASAVNAPNKIHSLVLWNKLLIVVAIYVVVANLAVGRVRMAVAAQCAVAAAVAAFGLIALGVWTLSGGQVDLGTQPAPYDTRVPYGTQWEGNIYGSYALAGLLLSLGLAASSARLPARMRRLAWATAALCLPALTVSVTRGAWVGLAAALGVAACVKVWGRRGAALRWAIAAVLVLLVAVAALLAAGAVGLVPALDPYSGPLIARRLASFTDLARDGNLWVRGEVLRQALVTWQAHPWIGWGIGAYGDMYQYPNQAVPAWVPNLFVHHLFDSGALGLTGLVLGVGLTAGRGVRAWTRARDTGLPGAECVAPLLLALLGLLVAFQTTEASWLAYPWIYLGLLEGAVWEDGMRRRRSDLTDAHAPGHAAGLAAHE